MFCLLPNLAASAIKSVKIPRTKGMQSTMRVSNHTIVYWKLPYAVFVSDMNFIILLLLLVVVVVVVLLI